MTNSPHVLRPERYLPAAQEIRFLIRRGYPRDSALNFTANHHQLSKAERELLFRGVFGREKARARKKKKVLARRLKGEVLLVDGYNVIITLESGMSGRPLVLGDDGFVRDISRVFRGFRATELTKRAWREINSFLKAHRPCRTEVMLDAPMSRSGLLASRITRWLNGAGLEGEAVTVRSPERRMLASEGIKAGADSVVLDRADRVFDLAGHILRRRLGIRPIRL